MMKKVSAVTPDKIDARVEKCMAKLSYSVDDLNTLYKLFEDRDREGNGLITVDDFFYKVLKINRSFYGDSLLELIDTERAEQISFGEFVQIFSVYCLFETQDVLRLCFFMFDKKKTGYVKREEIKNFIYLLHEGQIMSNAEVGMASIDKHGDGDGTFDFRQLRILHRNFPHLMYPAFRMQIIMQRVTLGESWWNTKKLELWDKQKLVLQAKKFEKDKKKQKANARKGKMATVQTMDVSMEFRVRDRMGKFRYTFMPWQRPAVLEQLETLDAIEAELEGENEIEEKVLKATSTEEKEKESKT